MDAVEIAEPDARAGLALARQELDAALAAVDPSAVASAARAVAGADRVFVLGLGRSGIALRALAMRLMHLGIEAHVVGETTAPAVRPGDVLVVASGSGTTASVVRSTEKAASLGVRIVVLTAAPGSPLAAASDLVVAVPAAVKTDHGGSASRQYAGSLFEQAVLVVGDALFHALWTASGTSAEELWTRHANLE
ncbi:6-phospho-3-hexuloisomerase [Microbacterium sp. NPDC055683]